MKKFIQTFKSLPSSTKQLLSLGIILALFVALPLFVWAITTQRFELRKRAQEVGPTPTALPPLASPTNLCAGQPNGTSCAICPACTYSVPRCLAPCQVGTCQNQVCVPGTPTPTPTPYPNPCQGQPDGTSCTGGGCPAPLIGPGGRPIPCTRPVFLGVCQNSICVLPLPTPTTTSCTLTPQISPFMLNIGENKGLIINYTETGGVLNDVRVASNNPDIALAPYVQAPKACPTAGPCIFETSIKGIASGNTSITIDGYINGVRTCTTKADVEVSFVCVNGSKGNLDCDTSGLINATDLSILLSQWSPITCVVPDPRPAGYPDLNSDCKINATDLSILLANWKPI